MTRFKSRFAAVVCSAILAAVPFAGAQTSAHRRRRFLGSVPRLHDRHQLSGSGQSG